jgi:hypothetical protein
VKTGFSDDFIARLNATYSGGVFFKAAILSVDNDTTLYFADTDYAITFDSHTYQMRPMSWQGLGQTSQQNLPTIQVVTTNVLGDIGDFLEETDLLGREVQLLILHRDLLGTVTDSDRVRLSILATDWDSQQATFHLGLNIGLSETLPRHIITSKEFPGVPQGYRRASIL